MTLVLRLAGATVAVCFVSRIFGTICRGGGCLARAGGSAGSGKVEEMGGGLTLLQRRWSVGLVCCFSSRCLHAWCLRCQSNFGRRVTTTLRLAGALLVASQSLRRSVVAS